MVTPWTCIEPPIPPPRTRTHAPPAPCRLPWQVLGTSDELDEPVTFEVGTGEIMGNRLFQVRRGGGGGGGGGRGGWGWRLGGSRQEGDGTEPAMGRGSRGAVGKDGTAMRTRAPLAA